MKQLLKPYLSFGNEATTFCGSMGFKALIKPRFYIGLGL
jgi:hypothetical protein